MTTQMYVPPIYGLLPQVPPTQTVTGILNELGVQNDETCNVNGQMPNEDLWKARDEYIMNFNVSTSQLVDTVLASIYVGPCLGPAWNDPTDVSCNYMWPRIVSLNSCVYAKTDVCFTFWAVKPPATAGKIRIVYNPSEYGNIKTVGTTAIGSLDPLQRAYMWEWDLSQKQVFSITIKGNNPNNMFPINLRNNIPVSLTGGYVLGDDTPFFNKTYGSLTLLVQNQYIPGSIFPDNFYIHVFKHLENCETSVLTGHRSFADKIVT